MAKNYVSCDRNTSFLLPPSLTDWLPDGHLAWFVIDAVGRIDTTALHLRHPNWGPGRAAYDPDMLLALLLYAYCTGTWSSRDIERACGEDIAYRVIAANQLPDHGTIARFRAGCENEIGDLFVQVLALCAEAGMAKLGIVALDGTKISASASLKATRSAAQIQKEIDALQARIEKEVAAMLERAAAEDAEGDRLFGVERGDEVPKHLRNPNSRLAHFEAAMRRLEQRREEARANEREALADTTAKQVGTARKARNLRVPKRRTRTPSVAQAEADLEVATAEAEAAKAARAEVEATAEAEGRRPKGPTPDLERGIARAKAELARAHQAEAEDAAGARINTTDPDSEIMKTKKGYLQGYNAQAVVSEDQIILAAEVTTCAADVGQYVPMIDAALANTAAAGSPEAIGCVLADAGYVSNDNFAAAGPDRLIATTKAYKMKRQLLEGGFHTGPPPIEATLLDAMTWRLLTEEGAAAYAMRQYTVEPVFGQIKENRSYRRFMRRGLPAVAAEWKLVAMTHNLLKLFAKATRDPSKAASTAAVALCALRRTARKPWIPAVRPVASPAAA
jgi:transposase